MDIKRIQKTEMPEMQTLVWEVFMKFEGSEYEISGIEEFRSFLYNKTIFDHVEFWGAYSNMELIGVIASRNNRKHITLFFVKENYHKQGVGRKLWEHFLQQTTHSSISVNSSPYALEVYRALGFVDTDKEQITNGIRYIPMLYTKST